MKKYVVALIGLLLISICFSTVVSGIKVWPGKHEITINKWYGQDETVKRPTVQIMNTESYDITVRINKDNPSEKQLTKGYSLIPDLSWIKTYPEELVIPAKSDRTFEIAIEVPESEQSSYYNERWEAWIIIIPPIKNGSGFNVQTEIAVKLLIKTPQGEAGLMPSVYIFLISLFLVFFILIALYIKNKKKTDPTLYYFKKKK